MMASIQEITNCFGDRMDRDNKERGSARFIGAVDTKGRNVTTTNVKNIISCQ